MLRKSIILFLAAGLMLLSSCKIRDSYDHCGVYLEFIFDHNMDYEDTFVSEISDVDVYVFDGKGRFLFTRHAECAGLTDGKKMWLNDMEFNTYKILVVGGMCEHFSLASHDGGELVPGEHDIQHARLALRRLAAETDKEFPHIWFGEKTVEIDYSADQSVWPVRLVRNTNKFKVELSRRDKSSDPGTRSSAPYTFEIVAPEGAVYDCDNNPSIREKVVYKTYDLNTGGSGGAISVGRLNTMRLFDDDPDGYQLIVRKTSTGEKMWEFDLMEFLRKRKPASRPDGSTLPMQEYLDREWNWELNILYDLDDDSAFMAVAIVVNGWIIWLNEIEA